jgi:hypothetical protein
MGNEVGVYENNEVQDLTEEERKQLKKHTLDQLHASQDVRDIINNNPLLVTKDPNINKALRAVLDPRLDRIKKKLPPE